MRPARGQPADKIAPCQRAFCALGEMVDARDLKSLGAIHIGSSPIVRTTLKHGPVAQRLEPSAHNGLILVRVQAGLLFCVACATFFARYTLYIHYILISYSCIYHITFKNFA